MQYNTITTSGQLGDGAAIYLGEVIGRCCPPLCVGQQRQGEEYEGEARWELQLKGAGLTPYSRTADGRKVHLLFNCLIVSSVTNEAFLSTLSSTRFF